MDLSQRSASSHDFLVRPVKDCPRPELAAVYRRQLPDESGIVFAHADVSWENILVDCASGHVTGILDREMAGFWPEWWEYRKAIYGARSKPWWMRRLSRTLCRSIQEKRMPTWIWRCSECASHK